MLFLSSLDSLLEDAYIIVQKGVDDFEKKHANFWLGMQYLLKVNCLGQGTQNFTRPNSF